MPVNLLEFEAATISMVSGHSGDALEEPRIGMYVRRWVRWARAGLGVDLSGPKNVSWKSEIFQNRLYEISRENGF